MSFLSVIYAAFYPQNLNKALSPLTSAGSYKKKPSLPMKVEQQVEFFTKKKETSKKNANTNNGTKIKNEFWAIFF